MGYIYIMTNPSFENFVKIGYAEDVERRLKEFNNSTVLPYSFRVYATYKVDSKLTDKKVHAIIDSLNPDLRSIETLNGKERKREFFSMTKESAYSLLKAIAEINGLERNLKIWKMSEDDKRNEAEVNRVNKLAKPLDFNDIDIKPGEIVELWHHNKRIAECKVIDNKKVLFEGEAQSLTSVVKNKLGMKSPAGPDYFKYKGRWLNDIRREKGLLNF